MRISFLLTPRARPLRGGASTPLALLLVLSGGACQIADVNRTEDGGLASAGLLTDLPQSVGFHRAAQMVLTGDAWDANEARLMGLVGKVVPQKELIPTAVAMAERIAECHPKAVRLNKDLLYKSQTLSYDDWMDYLVLGQVTQDSDQEMITWRKAYDGGGYKGKSRFMHEGPKED